jgi:hypothetical protein
VISRSARNDIEHLKNGHTGHDQDHRPVNPYAPHPPKAFGWVDKAACDHRHQNAVIEKAGRALRKAKDIYVLQILKTEGFHWLRRVGLDGEPGVTSGAPILLLETGVPVADRGIDWQLGGIGIRRQPLDLLVISRPLAKRELTPEKDRSGCDQEDAGDRDRDHPPPRRHPGQSHGLGLSYEVARANTKRPFTPAVRRNSLNDVPDFVNALGISTLYTSGICNSAIWWLTDIRDSVAHQLPKIPRRDVRRTGVQPLIGRNASSPSGSKPMSRFASDLLVAWENSIGAFGRGFSGLPETALWKSIDVHDADGSSGRRSLASASRAALTGTREL